ncbi:MAG TPA: hypothetical protein VGD81_12900 [Opitutaceae bacterium]
MSLESVSTPRRRSIARSMSHGLYTWGALAALIVVFAGFARTYYLKHYFGAPALSLLVHVHGLVMTLWFSLFAVQVWLVAAHRVDLHRRLGLAGALLAALVVGIGTLTAITAARNGVSPGPPPLVFLAIPLGDMLVFAALVSAGLACRRAAALHKRLLLLSSLSMLTAAIARIPIDAIARGGLPLFFGLTDVVILACVGVDAVKHRRLHPAFGWGFAFIVASQAFRFWLAGTPQWHRFAVWLTG